MMLATGQTLNGRYQITQELAQGGFGATFLAEDRYLPERPLCVVKQLRPQTSDPSALKTARRLFETEAQILHELGKHDQIPMLLAYFEEQQEFYLVEEYIRGQSLREEIRTKGKLTAAEVTAILREILEILVFVHGHQVIHRDLNPSNLIRRALDQRLCLIDFGAVKRVSTQFVQSSGMATVAIGTQGYLPSEQAQGRPQFGSDIYAVGMIAVEALTGQFPHLIATDPRTAELLWHGLVNIDPELMALIDKMIRHDFRERFFSAQAALDALNELGQPQSKTLVLQPPSPQAQSPSVVVSSLPTNVLAANVASTDMPDVLAVGNGKDRTAIAIAAGLGLAALVSIVVSLNLGLQWLSNRQARSEQFAQAQLAQELKQYDNALTGYQEVLNQNQQHEGALLGKAQVLQQLERYDEALATYDELLKLNPNVWEAWWGRGKILSDRKDYDQALISLDKAIQGNSRDIEIWQVKTQIHLAQKDQDNALSSLESLLKLDDRQAWAWYEKGWIHQSREQYRDAIAAYDRALRINSTDPNIWYQRGNSYYKLEDYKEAKNSYSKVVSLKPSHAPAWYSQGICYENLKQYDEAERSFAKVVELEPNNDRAWYHLAWNAQQNNRQTEAIAAYQRTVQLKNNDHDSQRNLANLLYDAQKYPGAIAAYDQALAIEPADGDSWERKGNAHNELAQYAEAIAAYDQALKYKPNNPEILANQQEAKARLEWESTQQEIKKDIKDKADKIKSGIQDLLPLP
jgi:tetratricopeptide (TPR) repeat protein